jgi:hypothetical protein
MSIFLGSRTATALWLILSSFALSVPAIGQRSATAEDTIRRMIMTGIIEGHDQKVIGSMGDAAAVAIIKILGEQPVSQLQSDMVLNILVSSFTGSTTEPADMEPRAALFVLRCLASQTKEAAMQKQIAEVRTRILAARSHGLK